MPTAIRPSFSASPAIRFRSWDGFLLPLPFARGVLAWGAPIRVPRAAPLTEPYRRELEQALTLLTQAADRQILLTDWQQRNVTFFSALEVERNVMFLILSLIILIAALNIISGLTMLVKEKGHAIAILRTMGASRGSIMRIFFIIGSSIGAIGTMAGFLLGLVISLNIETIREWIASFFTTDVFSSELYFLSQLPADMDPGETATVIVMALGLSFLATLYPAWSAARLDPVEALRYE